jgi:hypothetical protein
MFINVDRQYINKKLEHIFFRVIGMQSEAKGLQKKQ